jgi:hypothetical protein
MTVKKGDLVEFTKETYSLDYPPEDRSLILYGVAIKDENPDGSVQVEMADGRITMARNIHAYAWLGWIPDGLEEIYRELNLDSHDDDWDDE